MDLNEYQEKAGEFAIFPKSAGIIYPVLGLVGEAGEVAEKFKKVIRDKDGWMSKDDSHEMLKEIGDVLWYVAALTNSLGFSLQTVAEINLDKLQSRKDRNAIQGSGDNR